MLTQAQKKIAKTVIDAGEGAYLVAHIKPTDTKCYRLLTSDHRPIINVQWGVVRRMISADLLQQTEGRIGPVYVPSEALKTAFDKMRNRKKKTA